MFPIRSVGEKSSRTLIFQWSDMRLLNVLRCPLPCPRYLLEFGGNSSYDWHYYNRGRYRRRTGCFFRGVATVGSAQILTGAIPAAILAWPQMDGSYG